MAAIDPSSPKRALAPPARALVAETVHTKLPFLAELLALAPLAGDASNRRYFRLELAGGPPRSLILMQLAEPEAFKQSEEAVSGTAVPVTELPYMVNKARLAEKIALLVNTRRIGDIADLKDESSRAGMRLVIELKRNANPHVVLNQLYKHTQLQDTFGVNMLALVDGVPRTLNLKQAIGHYIEHQVQVVTRRSRYELRKAEERDHIVQGLLIALQHIDEVIKIIRASADTDAARTTMSRWF